MSRRRERINDLLREEISELLQRQLRDPRLDSLMSITSVEISLDLKHAKVFVSVMDSEERKREALQALESASGFLRRELKKRLSLRYIPSLIFERDDSIERGAHLLELIRKVAPEEKV